MRYLTPFVLGVALTLSLLYAVAGFAQDKPMQLAGPIVVRIQQAVPILANVAMPVNDELVTATLPLTIDVDLRVAIQGESYTVLTPTQPAAVKVISGTENTDDLGLNYRIDNQVEGMTLNEWTAYQDTNSYIEFFGEVALAEGAEPANNEISCIVRFYKNGKLVKVEQIGNVGFRLEPGGTNQFDGGTYVAPGEVDSYTVAFKLNR